MNPEIKENSRTFQILSRIPENLENWISSKFYSGIFVDDGKRFVLQNQRRGTQGEHQESKNVMNGFRFFLHGNATKTMFEFPVERSNFQSNVQNSKKRDIRKMRSHLQKSNKKQYKIK